MKVKVLTALAGLVLPLSAQYSGPAVLSRGDSPAGLSFPPIKFRPFLNVGATYNTALSDVRGDDQGQLANRSSWGQQLAWGVSGTHSWRHTQLGLDYRGSYNRYSRSNSNFDNQSHTMNLGFSRQIARHAFITLRQSAGIVNRDYGLLGLQQSVPFDPSESNIPTTDFFNNQTYYFSSLGGLTIQKSTRLSFNFGGGMSMTRRQSRALYGTTARSAQGDAQYRLSRRMTVGFMYRFQHFTFTRIFGSSVAHAVAGSFGMLLTRRVEFSAYAGIMRPEATFQQSVRIDPVIAELLGISTGTQITNRKFYTGMYGARISKAFENGVVFASVGRGLTPGNGLFLTSLQTNVTAGYGYTGLRRWSFNVGATRTWAESIGNVTGKYHTTSGRLAASRSLRFGLHMIVSYTIRQYNSPSFSNYSRVNHGATVALGWTPGPVPLRVW